MTKAQYVDYLREMEDSGLLSQIYNGWRILMDKEVVENVTLDVVLSDNAFILWDKRAMEVEYRRGL